MPPHPIRLLHLSDLHFSEKRGWDRDPVLAGLVRDVAGLVSTVGALDLAVITGDIANFGKAEEYVRASAWLTGPLANATGLDAQRIRVVPGNHDVDRGAIGTVAKALTKELHAQASEDYLGDLLNNPEDRAPLLKRQAAYLDFARLFHPGLDAPWWSETRDIRGWKLHLAGLNSAWLCSSDTDRGQLLLGRRQVNRLLADADDADLSIVLMHHPWDYLAEWDADSEEAVRRKCGVILSGHLHQQKARLAGDPDRDVLQLAAGASYSGSGWANAYQVLELDPGAGAARVYFRLWDGFEWIPDRNRYQSASDGVAALKLRKTTRAPSAIGPVTSPLPQPILPQPILPQANPTPPVHNPLRSDELTRLAKALANAGLASSRHLLVGALRPESQPPERPGVPVAVFLGDLQFLNLNPVHHGAYPAFARYLECARELATTDTLLAEIDAALARIRGLDRPLPDASPGLVLADAALHAPTFVPESVLAKGDAFLRTEFLTVGAARARAVVRVRRKDQPGFYGTGFLIAPDRVVTCHHVLPDAAAAAASLFDFGYEDTLTQPPTPTETIRGLASGFRTSAEHDLTVVSLSAPPAGSWAPLEVPDPPLIPRTEDFVHIVQHPSGGPKRLVVYRNLVTWVGADRVQYLTDTMPGSSGSPVFDREWNLVAVHHAGGLRAPGSAWVGNEGIRVERLRDLLR